MPWMQASNAFPCPICGRKHYCTMKPDQGIVKCTTVSDGAFSFKKDNAGVGFFHKHKFDGIVPDPPKKEIKASQDWASAMKEAVTAPRRHFRTLARFFGCSPNHLREWEVGFLTNRQLEALDTRCNEYGCWTFPMRDAQGKVIGLRLRTPNGFKYAVRGSQNGLFYKTGLTPGRPLLVVDGASDALAGFVQNLHLVGRPSSTTGNDHLLPLIQRLQPIYVTQLLDDDEGDTRQHAYDTARDVLDSYPYGSIIYPEKGKDLREWLATQRSVPKTLYALANTCGRTVKA